MNKLNYIVEWGGNRLKAWSGTNNSLCAALSSHYDLKEYELKGDSIWTKLTNRFLHKKDLGLKKILFNRKQLDSLTGTTFQFVDILKTTPERPTYIYQDLCVNFLNNLRINKNPSFQYSGFQIVNPHTFDKRSKMEVDYYQGATGIFTMGRWLAKYLSSTFPEFSDKVYHAGGGINLNKSAINPSDRKNNKILFIGRDFKRKGGPEVIQAFKLLQKEIPGIELHIAGPNRNPAPDIKNVFYYGDAPKEVLHDLMNRCDLFCMPSHFEAYGLVFIEALCFGLPCIGRDCFEMPYFIEEGETGELVKTNEIGELADKIKKILSNDSYQNNVIKKRDEYIREYSWDTVAERISKIIK